jgi:hypothetical protein
MVKNARQPTPRNAKPAQPDAVSDSGPLTSDLTDVAPFGPTRRLTNDELRAAQLETLASPRRHPSLFAKLLFLMMDVVYGAEATLEKFRVLEVIARVPYQAWEHVSYIAMTHTARERGFARRVFERVRVNRRQQDNEQWHLLILEELTANTESRGWIKHRLVPQIIAFFYYHLSWLLYSIRPDWSYRLNADFEDHAEHEYAAYVEANPQHDDVPYDGDFVNEYGAFDSISDLLRQISYDERMHKQESIAQIQTARFR